MELKVLEIDMPIDEFMETKEFDTAVNEPARQYFNTVYLKSTQGLTPVQIKLFDIWWNGGLYPWIFLESKTSPEGYEWCTYEDLKSAYESILDAVSLGCG